MKVFVDRIDWEKCPLEHRDAMKRYVLEQRRPGAAIEAVLLGDLRRALVLNTAPNGLGAAVLRELVSFVHNELPSTLHALMRFRANDPVTDWVSGLNGPRDPREAPYHEQPKCP